MPAADTGGINRTAWLYMLLHALVEIVCFAALYQRFGGPLAWCSSLVFDAFAFVPQAVFGEFFNRNRSVHMGTAGTILLAGGALLSAAAGDGLYLLGLAVMCLGNAVLHECGAIATVRTGGGKLFPAALFVSGGSFGLIIGQTLGKAGISTLWLLIPAVLVELIVLATDGSWVGESGGAELPYPEYDLTRPDAGFWLVVAMAFAVTAVRSFIGYAIPISWKKEMWQAFLLFFMMGFGKALGGWCSDRFGARLTGIWTTLLSVPFLIAGEERMVISIIGVFLFSMTMSITFGMLLSVIRQNPGLAFGVTTIALFMGIVPLFLFGNLPRMVNICLIVILSMGCSAAFAKTLK